MKLSNMSDLFLSNVHLSLYWSQAFLDRNSHSNVAFACIKCVSGNVRSSLIGCWDQLQAVTDRVRHGGLQGWRVTGLDRIWYQTMGTESYKGFCVGDTGLDRVWYQVVGTGCHKAWIRFSSG